MSDIFISYAHEDAGVVDDICNILSANQISFFRDEKSIPWGGHIDDQVRNALKQALAVLVVMSPASLKSHWVHYEIGFASALARRVLPYLTHPSLEPPGYIVSLRYFTDLDQVDTYFSKFDAAKLIPPETPERELLENDKRRTFISLVQKMPALIAEMREDVNSDDTGLIRECLVLSSDRILVNSAKPRFAYYEDQHEYLLNKFDLLEENGFVYRVYGSNMTIYRMTEEFVRLLEMVA